MTSTSSKAEPFHESTRHFRSTALRRNGISESETSSLMSIAFIINSAKHFPTAKNN